MHCCKPEHAPEPLTCPKPGLPLEAAVVVDVLPGHHCILHWHLTLQRSCFQLSSLRCAHTPSDSSLQARSAMPPARRSGWKRIPCRVLHEPSRALSTESLRVIQAQGLHVIQELGLHTKQLDLSSCQIGLLVVLFGPPDV